MPVTRLPKLLFALVISLVVVYPGHASAANLVRNPGFESGNASWTQTSLFGNLIYNDAAAAHDGSGYAWLGGYDNGTDTLLQDIAIPASAGDARLQFWYRIATHETSSANAYDTLAVSISSPSTGASLMTVATYSNLNATQGWTQSPAYDVSSFRGQTIRLKFTALTDFSNNTNFRIDDVSLSTSADASSSSSNYSDIWWNPLESGWGLTIADHQTQLFAVWYTYRQDGSPTWFVIPGGTFTAGRRLFAGDIYQTTGPPYTGAFDATQVRATKVGTANIDFAPPGLAAGSALFTYSVGSVSGSKQIQRQPFGDAPSAWGTDLTDIYWDPAESGWGLTVSQHGNIVFAVWYTYDTSGQPLFVVMPGATFSDANTFTGDIYTTTGPYFGNASFDASQVRATNVGSVTMEFDSTAAAALMAKATRPCVTYFLGCNARMHGRIRNGTFGKWISPQGFGYAAPDTPAPSCQVLYNEWSACVNGTQSATERIRVPAGCTSQQSSVMTRACPVPGTPQACTYSYGAPYGTCFNGVRTHTLLGATPTGCTGTPVLTEACTAPACNYFYGSPYGACINGVRTHTLLSTTPAGCTGTPILTESCTNAQLPPGFPTNLTLGTYRLTISVCATLVGCITQSQTLVNTDIQTFANQLVSVLNASALPSAGCSSSTSYSGFNGTSFTATLTTVCTSGSASASSTVTITVTKI